MALIPDSMWQMQSTHHARPCTGPQHRKTRRPGLAQSLSSELKAGWQGRHLERREEFQAEGLVQEDRRAEHHMVHRRESMALSAQREKGGHTAMEPLKCQDTASGHESEHDQRYYSQIHFVFCN